MFGTLEEPKKYRWQAYFLSSSLSMPQLGCFTNSRIVRGAARKQVKILHPDTYKPQWGRGQCRTRSVLRTREICRPHLARSYRR